MISGINHVGVSVVKLDRAIEFYRDVLGMQMVVQARFEGEKYEAILGLKGARGTAALLRLGNFRIELFEFEHPSPKPSDSNRPVCDHGITHFCLQVTGIHSIYARMKAAGVGFHSRPQDFSGKAIAVYARDPDGNVIELLEKIGAGESVDSEEPSRQ